MRVSKAGIDLIKLYEGVNKDKQGLHKPYMCPAGLLTIGYGHLCQPNSVVRRLSEIEAIELLQKDLSFAERAVSLYIAIDLNQSQFDALCSFTFNLGIGALRSSTLRRRLNNLESPSIVAQEEMIRWVFAGGRKLQGLIKRRNAEIALFMSEV